MEEMLPSPQGLLLGEGPPKTASVIKSLTRRTEPFIIIIVIVIVIIILISALLKWLNRSTMEEKEEKNTKEQRRKTIWNPAFTGKRRHRFHRSEEELTELCGVCRCWDTDIRWFFQSLNSVYWHFRQLISERWATNRWRWSGWAGSRPQEWAGVLTSNLLTCRPVLFLHISQEGILA